MLTHKEMINLQAEKHTLVDSNKFQSKQDYVLHLIGKSSYEQASRFAKNKIALDLGCNTGYGTAMISRTAKKVIGVDVSEKALKIASNQYRYTNLFFQKIDGVKLPFADNEFDLIVSFQVIEHIVNYDTYINEIKRVLRSDGIVLFTTPNAHLRIDPGMPPWNKFHVREFSSQELKSLLNKYFTDVKIMGLRAEEPLNSIELKRLQNALESARRNINDPVRRLAKKIIPENLINLVKKLIKSVKINSEKKEGIEKFIINHGIEEIYYSPDNLENALDYLAICSNDKKSLEKTWLGLPKQQQNRVLQA